MIRSAKYVIDASAAVEYLLRTALGKAVGEVIESAVLAAPERNDIARPRLDNRAIP